MNGGRQAHTPKEHERRTVDALGIATSYYAAGDPSKDAVVLLHGMSSSGDSFREMMHALAGSYYLIAPDIPGFGYSDNTTPYRIPHLVEWLAALFDALELRPAHIGGHSFGGVLGTSFTYAYPEDVCSLMLLAPALLVVDEFPDWMLGMARYGFSQAVLDLGVRTSRIMLQRQIQAPFYDPGRLDESLWARRQRDYEHARASASALRAVALHDIAGELSELRRPNCLIWGQHDEVVNPAGGAILASVMPDTELHLLAECGHAPQIEQTERSAAIMRQFMPRAANEVQGGERVGR